MVNKTGVKINVSLRINPLERLNSATCKALADQIQLIERDDEAKNERGVQIAQELINKEKVVATLGFINTGVALASQRFYQEAKIPVFNNVATGSVVTQQFKAPEFPDNYIFRNAAHDSIQAPMIVEEAIARRGFKKVAILADSTNYGQLGREDLEKALAAKGVKAVAVEKFNIKDVDMTPQLLKAKEAGAEAVLTYGIGPELAQIANGMTKLGWKVPMVGSWTLSMANFIDNAGPGGEGARMPQTFIQEPNTVKRKAFIDAYLKTFKPKNNRIDSPVSAAQGYDSVYLLAAAIKQAGTTDGPKVREALENALPRLREALGDVGIQLGQANVGANTPQFASQQGETGHNPASGRLRNDADSALAHDAGLAVSAPTARWQQQGTSLVDAFA